MIEAAATEEGSAAKKAKVTGSETRSAAESSATVGGLAAKKKQPKVTGSETRSAQESSATVGGPASKKKPNETGPETRSSTSRSTQRQKEANVKIAIKDLQTARK